MNLKEQIQKDFLTAMKSGDKEVKLALSLLKSKITEAEKANKNEELADSDIIKVINSAIKQRKQSIDEYEKYGRMDLALKEKGELVAFQKYLPKQMTDVEIEVSLEEILNSDAIAQLLLKNKRAAIGKTIGDFNKKYNGMADISKVNVILTKIVESYV
jgi:uncharacterized protein YqeY